MKSFQERRTEEVVQKDSYKAHGQREAGQANKNLIS
jgi:hypothetical protein